MELVNRFVDLLLTDTVILIHTIFISLAIFTPLMIFWRKKGDRIHKINGWIFVILMFIGTLSSFWILTDGWFRWIHLLSIFVIVNLLQALYATRFKPKNWVYIHAKSMGATFIAIPIAGIGVLARHFIKVGDVTFGFILSAVMAAICIPLLIKLTKKYDISGKK